jgi:hypothetical protein
MGPELSGTPWVHPIGGQRCSPSRLALQRCDQVVAVARADVVGLYAFICGYQESDLTWPFGAPADQPSASAVPSNLVIPEMP